MSINDVPPLIHAQLNHILTHSPLSIKVDQMWSGSRYPSGLIDRFTFLIPYCLDYIKWDVIFNADYPMAAPDVIFGPDDENFNPFRLLEGQGESKLTKSSLCEWNSKNPAGLLVLIQELRDLYIIHQKKCVGEVDDDRLKFEISTIISREGLEMHMSSGIEKPEEVKFAVPLMDININKMIVGCPWRHQQKIYLQVVYPVGRKYASAPSVPRLKLVSAPELKALFSVDDVKLPPWLDGMCMAEYLPNLEETLQGQVLEAVSLIDVRRRFIEALAPLFGMPLEADSVFCRKATVLAATGAFTFLVHFFLPIQFPKQQPTLMLQSSQHFNTQGTPVKSSLIKGYPWSPRWDVSTMAERIFEFLAEESLNFKRFCNETQLQQH